MSLIPKRKSDSRDSSENNNTTSQVFAFGANSDSQLANNADASSSTPLLIRTLPPSIVVQKISCGAAHAILLSGAGELFTWGSNSHGQLTRREGSNSRPTRVDAFQAFTLVDIGAGERFSAAVTSDGGLFTWGANDAGQLGLGDFNEHREKPGRVAGAVEREHVMRVACGSAHLIALARSGAVFGVGDGSSGQLGKGDRERRRYISALSHLSGVAVRGIACGARHTVFLTVEGTVLTCGANDFGQLGVATRFGASASFAHVSSPTHSLIEPLIPGAEYAGSPNGVLSQTPSLVNTPTPVRALRGRAICHVECGANHCIAISDDGSVFVWGSNHFGQLGLPANDKVVGAPTLLVAVKPDRIVAAAGGVRHSLFVTSRGTVRSFGQGSAGQLGRTSSESDNNFVTGFDGFAVASTTSDDSADERDQFSAKRAMSIDHHPHSAVDDELDGAAPADVDLDSVAFEDSEQQAVVSAAAAAASTTTASRLALGVAAGGMFSFAWTGAASTDDSEDAVRQLLDARYERTAVPHLSLRALHRLFDSASNERWQLRRRAANAQLVQSLDGVSVAPVVRHEWFQSDQLATLEVFLPDCSAAGSSVSVCADGSVMLALQRPAIRLHIVPWAAVSEVVAATMPPTAQVTFAVDKQETRSESVAGVDASSAVGRKLIVRLRKATPGVSWGGLEAPSVNGLRRDAALALERHSDSFGKRLSSLLESSFATLASVNASFLSGALDRGTDAHGSALDLRGVLWFFHQLLVAPELSHAGVRAGVLETLQRCALDVADQLLRCVTSSAPSALSGTSSIWSDALRVVVLLLVAPTSATQTARAFNTRTRLCTSLSRLAATRRQQLYEWLLIEPTTRDDAPFNNNDALVERERVWLGAVAAGEKSTAFGRALGTLRAHHESLLGEDAARNERDAIVCTRLLAELFSFNEQHALVPRAAFNNATIDRMSDTELFAHYQRWQTPSNTQWTFLSQPFLLSLDVKRRVLRIEEAIVQQSHVGQAVLSELTTTGQLSAMTLRCAITVRRDNLLEDALEQLRLASSENRLKRPLFVQFAGEAGVDEGGVRKEFFQLALRALLREEYGMFVRNPSTGRYWLRMCDFPDSRGLFELSGMLIGLALYNNVLLEARFPAALWRKLLAPESEHVSDLAALGTVFPDVAHNLQQLLDYAGDVEQDFDLNFTVTQDVFGAQKTHALLADGANVPVTNRNRERYVQLFSDWQLNGSVAPQFEAFRRGFLAAAGGTALTLLNAGELEQLVCGADDQLYDLSLLRRHVRYEGGYDDNSPTIAAFWKAVTPSPAEMLAAERRRAQLEQQAGWSAGHADDEAAGGAAAANDTAADENNGARLTADERRRLLAFMTGSDRVPMDGLGEMRVMIQKNGSDAKRFVTSSTCFNLLLLPEYADEATLLRNLRIAAEHSEGFGMQ